MVQKNIEDFINEVTSSIGKNKIITDNLILKLYSKEPSGLMGNISAVIFPESKEDVSKILSIAYKYEVNIYPQGSSSSLSGNAVPLRDGVIVSFERMNKIKDLSITDNIVIAEPGVRIDELNLFLEKYNYMFPIDPASQSVATIGGAINNGAGGLKGAKYGTMKDWVNGMEIALPDEKGTRLFVGCMTVKCRKGYDLARLIIGSEGTLALVTEAVLRITPIPESIVTSLALFDNLDDLLNSFIEIKSIGMQPYIAEFMDSKTVEVASKGVDINFEPKGNMLLLSIDTNKESTERMKKFLEDTLKKHNANKIITSLSQQEAEELGLFKIRRNLFAAQVSMGYSLYGNGKKLQVFIEDIVVPPSKIKLAINKIREVSENYGLFVSIGGHIGDGNIHPSVVYDVTDENMKTKVVSWYKDVMKIALDLNGSVSAEHGIGLLKKDGLIMEMTHYNSLKEIDIMKSIKSLFDPKGILNPGKVL
ncbi:FAD/FMN-dependent dehydrogenase [Caldisphaera lagunensis DSM 15908]|uniref:FAD/FMN-dependent dehydrogenase n=1 Tax=Caldisphaera lagunensis (strain DSM 15908 / JCM 11604 / ANMR 0165 / IC-154) TaxID=1056495 RepID=L0AAG2_CALLD|nr:FAD-linked oxidase C-terminal domain-containing protein [Caldisphaera lagunensis]AFZ70030.1 FAD/FMN-dependent dehydrogenase [Caldisphaera lagunensis DSM 15908]